MISNGDDDNGGGEGSDDAYKGSAEPVLISLSDLYSEDNRFLSR